MKRRTSTVLAYWMFSVTLLLVAVEAVLLGLSFDALSFGGTFAFRGFGGLFALSFGVVGVLIASRRPENRIGWIFCIVGLLAGVLEAADQYSIYALLTRGGRLPGGRFAAWLASWLWVPVTGLAGPMLFQLFPNGKPLSRRWRSGIVVLVTGIVAGSIGSMFSPGLLDDTGRGPNPYGVGDPDMMEALEIIGLMLYLSGVIMSTASVLVRYRRSSGEERQQMKWLVSASGLIALALLSIISLGVVAEGVRGIAVPFGVYKTFELIMMVGFLAVPVATGIAVLKYRLYEIDVLLSRTVLYGVLVGFITIAYAAVVIGVGALVGGAQSNFFLSLIATTLIAIMFHPVQQRARVFANRFVYGKRFTPYQALAEFSRRVNSAVSLDEILPNMARAAADALGAERARVTVFLAGGGERIAAWPDEEFDDSAAHATQVFERGVHVGEVAVVKRRGEGLTPAEGKLLEDIAAQSGPSLSNVRLAQDLRASRQRIIAAQDEERRRMERDIHDGAQQQLVAMAVKLSLARSLIQTDQGKAAELLDALKEDATDAVDSVRDLARGIFPPLLRERGLVPALEAHIAKSEMDATIAAPARDMRLSEEAEAALYFVVREALQNAAKHAPGAKVEINVELNRSSMEVAVTDEGPGFDEAAIRSGAGLRNMADRLEALGGRLTVDSAPGRGTRILASVPA